MGKYGVRFFVLVAALISCCVGFAAEPADSSIKAAVDDLARFQQQLGPTPSKSSVNRTLKLLTLTRQRLDSSNNKSDPSWIEADKKLTAYVGQLKQYVGQSSATSSSTAATPPANQQQTRTAPAAASSQPAPQMISQDVARLKKLIRDIKSATDSVDKGGPKPFQDAAYVKKFEDVAERHRQSLGRYANFQSHPDVQAASEALQVLNNMIAFGKSEGQKALKELGDVQAGLAQIRQMISNDPPPKIPDPLTPDAISQWLKQSADVREKSQARYNALNIYREKAYLPLTRGTVEQGAPYDMQNVDSMQSVLDRNVREIDNNLKTLALNFDSQTPHVQRTIDFFKEMDPTDENHRSNSFLSEGAKTQRLETIDRDILTVQNMVAFDQLMKRASLSQNQSLLSQLQSTRSEYLKKHQQALTLSRMPKAATKDGKLEDIAEEVLANPKYGVGKVMRLVINSDKAHHKKESSEVEFDEVDVSLSGKVTLKGTETTTFYEWDQFQVATAEPVGDKYYVFYNTLKFFTSGATTTPLNRWVMSGRLQGAEILEQNIKKN